MKNTYKPRIVTWKKYKAENNIPTATHIVLSKLKEQGFIEHKILKSSTEKKTVEELINGFINGKGYDIVIYHAIRSGRFNPMFNIVILTK